MYKIILKAGEIFKEGFVSSLKVNKKGIKDLVTEYDLKIENFLKEEFSKLGYKILAEESGGDIDLSNSVIIDPIDGTTNFFHKLPFCAISVGIYKDNNPYLAYVYNPILDEFFYAKKNEGAYLNNKKITVSNTKNFQDALIATGFPYSSNENKKDLKEVITKLNNVLPQCRDVRRFGSAALDLCYVACGKFDGFYEMNLKPWDVSAGILVVKEAGGKVTNIKNEKYNFNDKWIVASNNFIHKTFINTLN